MIGSVGTVAVHPENGSLAKDGSVRANKIAYSRKLKGRQQYDSIGAGDTGGVCFSCNCATLDSVASCIPMIMDVRPATESPTSGKKCLVVVTTQPEVDNSVTNFDTLRQS
jgi:hypothetical protein